MSSIVCETGGRVLWVTINRPEQRNAIDDEVIAGITEALRRTATDPVLRALVLTGAGDKAFCAGADLKQASRSAGGVFTSDRDTHPMIEMVRAVQIEGRGALSDPGRVVGRRS